MNQKKLIVGNWKMNGLQADSLERVGQLLAAAKSRESLPFDMVLCPPATLIGKVVEVVSGSPLGVGGQDCHAEAAGAFTGNIAAPMLKDAGCGFVIVGHSERRQYQKETSADVAAKAKAAHAAGLVAIICIGETDAERSTGREEAVVGEQLAQSVPDTATPENTVIAYEPVWAIGTGKVASADDIRKMHAFIHYKSKVKARILYGGSVKGANAQEIMGIPQVDGVLVGGASLKADEFLQIAAAGSGG